MLSCRKTTAKFWSNNFKYWYTWGLYADGQLEVDLNTIRVDIGLKFGLQVLPDGREVPMVTGNDVVVKIDRFDLDIKIHGSFFSDAVNLIKPFIKGTLCDIIQQDIYNALETTMPNLINKGMAKSDGYLHFSPTFELDWETPSKFLVTADAFEGSFKGLFFDSAYGELEPSVAIPSMPTFNTASPDTFQIFISTYAMDGFFTGLLEETPLGIWVNGDYTTSITTGSLNTFLPGIKSFYGDVPAAVKMSIEKLGSFECAQGTAMLNSVGTMTLEFWAQTATGPQLATSMTLVDPALGFGIITNAMTMQIVLATTNVSSVTVNSCAFGRLSALVLKTEMNNFFKVFTPIINKDLAASPITVPSNVHGIFGLSDLSIGYYNSYLYFGMQTTVIVPALAVEEQLAVYQ